MPAQDNGYHSKAASIETQHTLSLIEPELRPGDTILDVGCGTAYVTWQLAEREHGTVLAVDIVDCRRKPTPHFTLYDGIQLPFEDKSCDVIVLGFVLHHVPNETKPLVMAEIHRVCKRRVIVLEDTPRNFIDRYFNRRHGETFRTKYGLTHDFGFFSQCEWEAWFPQHGFTVVRSTKVGRFARDWRQPYARGCFVLEPQRQ